MVADNEILITVRMNDLFSTPFTQIESSMGALSMKMNAIQLPFKETIINSKKIDTSFKLLTGTIKRFRMEMLSVMFFGMGISAFFTGLLSPAMNLIGVFEIWNTTLAIGFLPIAEKVMDIMLKIMDWFIGLPENVQLALGTIALLGIVFGTLLMVIGMLSLGFDGLSTFFIKMGIALAGNQTALSIIAAIFSNLWLILGIGIILLMGFWMAWQENFGKIRDWVNMIWEGLKTIFSGIMNIVSGIIQVIVGLFSGDGDMVIKGVKLLIQGIIQVFWGLLEFIGGLVVTIGLALFRGFLGILATLTDLLGKGFGLLWENVLVPLGNALDKWVIQPFKNAFIGIINWIIDRINDLIGFANNVPGVNLDTIDHIGSRQLGGFVPYTGMYKLHEGEQVSTSSENNLNFNPNITINASSGMDIDMLKSQLSDQWYREINNVRR